MRINIKPALLAMSLASMTVNANPESVLVPEQLFTSQSSVMPENAIMGDMPVGVKTIKVSNDQSLNLKDFKSLSTRELTLEVWYPAKVNNNDQLASYSGVTRLHKPFLLQGEAYRDTTPANVEQGNPLVVLSHGYTGDRTIMFYLGEHLASHGYVVVGIDHTDSTTGEIDFVNSPTSGFVSTLINRSKDQQFVLDYFASSKSFLGKNVDTNKSSVIGYSMGGYGAINTVGGCYQLSSEGLQRLGFPEQAANALLPVFNFCNGGLTKMDERWKAMIAFAPWGQEINAHDVSQIRIPTLYVSGDHDDISGYEFGVKKLWEQTSSVENYLLTYQGARHNIAPHPAPQVAYENEADLGHYFEPAWNNEQLTRMNEHFSLTFLDCYVKEESSACALLPKRTNAAQIKGADGKLNKPWPGFKNRWATAITLEKK